MRVEKRIFFDLNLDEVAMVIHTHLKRLDVRHQTLSINVEKVVSDIMDENDPEKYVSVEKYTVIILASYDKLSNRELIGIYDKLQTNAIRRRSVK